MDEPTESAPPVFVGAPPSGIAVAVRSTAPWWTAGAAALGCVALAIVDPSERQVTPPCPFRVATGWWCPFCGGTRSVSRLVRGDLSAAFRFNALFVVSIPLILLAWWVWALPGRWNSADRVVRAVVGRRRFWVAVAAIAAVFVVARNLAPLDAYLRFPGA